VTVRGWEPRDPSALAEAASEEYIAAVWGPPAPGDSAGGERWLQSQAALEASGHGYSRAISLRGRPASGQIGLTLREEGRVSIWYWLAPSARGRGLAERAVRLLASWALTELRTARLEALIEPGNASSRRLVEKLGFTEEGLLRSFAALPGRRADVVMYSLLPGDPATAELAPPGG
jgi:[ribosomal protein S5]-alanine N-acetyltransferase